MQPRILVHSQHKEALGLDQSFSLVAEPALKRRDPLRLGFQSSYGKPRLVAESRDPGFWLGGNFERALGSPASAPHERCPRPRATHAHAPWSPNFCFCPGRCSYRKTTLGEHNYLALGGVEGAVVRGRPQQSADQSPPARGPQTVRLVRTTVLNGRSAPPAVESLNRGIDDAVPACTGARWNFVGVVPPRRAMQRTPLMTDGCS